MRTAPQPQHHCTQAGHYVLVTHPYRLIFAAYWPNDRWSRHTIVMHGFAKVEELIKTAPTIRAAVEDISKQLKKG